MSIQPTTESLAAWSLVLGIISIAGFTFLTGLLAVLWSPIVIIFIIGCAGVTCLPAVICGHLGRRKIKSNPTLRGPGMALAGLITGYIALSLSFGIIVATNVIGNIEGNKTLHEAELVSSRRYAETFVFVSAAVRARGYTKHWTTKQEAIQELVHGITVKSGGVDYGPFIVTLDERWKDKIEVISQHLRLVDDKLEAVP